MGMITANRERERKAAREAGKKLPVRLPDTISRLAHEAEVRDLRRAHFEEVKALRKSAAEADKLRARIAELEAEIEDLTAPPGEGEGDGQSAAEADKAGGKNEGAEAKSSGAPEENKADEKPSQKGSKKAGAKR